MTVKRFGTVLCAIAAFMLGGCERPPPGGTVSHAEGKPVGQGLGSTTQLDAGDDGSTVTVPASARFTVSLRSNPTTGYSWAIVDLNTSIVENTDHQYVQDAAPPGMVGVGGTETWEFTGCSAGTTTLRLEYRRPWEDKEEADSFEVTVTVTVEG